MITVPAPVGLGRDTAKRKAAREALAKVLWGPRGARRLPAERELVRAMTACDPRDVWWVCEMSSAGPVYLLPTREWVRELAKYLRTLGAELGVKASGGVRTAGDGDRMVAAGATRLGASSSVAIVSGGAGTSGY